MSIKINEQAVYDFLEFGVVKPGDTFLSSGEGSGEKLRTFVEESKQIEKSSQNNLINRFIKIFEEAIDEIVSQKKIDAFALSGGADSRLILSVLCKNHPERLKDLYVYTRIHPLLGADKDRDYLISKSVADVAGIEINGELSREHSQFYLKPVDKNFQTPLSGLWGTELLGGTIVSERLFSKFDLTLGRKDRPPSALVSYIERSVGGMKDYETWEYYILFHILRHTSCSAFYRSLTWFYPQAALTRCETPFLKESVVSFLSQINKNEILGYKLYSRILSQYCKMFSKVPINNLNLILDHHHGLDQVGIEPKGIVSDNTFVESQFPGYQQIQAIVEKNRTFRYSSYLLNILPYLAYFNQYQGGVD